MVQRKSRTTVDKVRASRDGHEFHEAWAARKVLQLVMPQDRLVGVAVEGLAPADQTGASAEAVEIADLVLYYGKRPTFAGATTVIIVQLKYSRGLQSSPYRASDARKTIRKFAAAFRSLRRQNGAKQAWAKLSFELVTNRPIASDFQQGLEGLGARLPLKGGPRKQAVQFASACGFKGAELARFAQMVSITGLAGNLVQNKAHLRRVLADWSVAPDAMSRARLGNLRQLVRDKAGLAGYGRNVIRRVDVLDALEVQGPDDLFPSAPTFPDIGRVVHREQLPLVARSVPRLDRSLLIHADGGVGKTVFLQSLAKVLGETHETILFDCFGGGAYRAPEDARHLPKRGLIHIANTLARDGLCDPLLPLNENVEDLVRAFRARLEQAVATLQRGSPGTQLVLVIDAIDNAAEHARDRNELSFPKLLLESFHFNGPVAGVQLIVSCRSYRRELARGDIPCVEVKLEPFSQLETEKYLRDRISDVTEGQIRVAYTRSEGNPRILEHLALSDRGLLDPSEVGHVISLTDLLMDRIRKALGEAAKRGYKERDINAFLAGLSVLPPPVPLDEYADAHGMDLSAVRSFATDLAPLLEQTKHGLMFRDEPTETLVREAYAAKAEALNVLIQNLFSKQGTSAYAASALPGLLQKVDNGSLLFDLAFDERFPATITSTVGKRNIRYARLKVAVRHFARKRDFDRLVHLLVEFATLAAVNERGTDYVLGNPDLAVAARDVDAIRRLVETRTVWPGTRHARLAIASVLSGDLNDAYRHLIQVDEWLQHFYQQNDEYRRDRGGPESLDAAAIPLCLVAHRRARDAAEAMKWWKDWYAYEVSERVFGLLELAERLETVPRSNLRDYLAALSSQLGVSTAAVSFLELDDATLRDLVRKIAQPRDGAKAIEFDQDVLERREDRLQDGLLKAAAIALALGMETEALTIAEMIPAQRLGLWSFSERLSNRDVLALIIETSVRAAAKGQPITHEALLPRELVQLVTETNVAGEDFKKLLRSRIKEIVEADARLPDEKKRIGNDTARDAERFIEERLQPLMELARDLAAVLSASRGKADQSFLKLVDTWTLLRKRRERYSDELEPNLFFDRLGRQLTVFVVWARRDLNPSPIATFVGRVGEHGLAPASTLVSIIGILSKRTALHELAGQAAQEARRLIEQEDEVSHRASLFARLARAMLPASAAEAASYFRLGLEQMDAIGSGDYQFTNELLAFAATLRGDELEESDFHTFANICELNMQSEEEKFPWLAFARALVRTSGAKTLARLGRWEDRDKVSLDYTLLPYLTALIDQDKIDPSIALGLLRLSTPAELYVCGTEQLAEVIAAKKYPNAKELLTELILQFEQNHPGVVLTGTLAALARLAATTLGTDSRESGYLTKAAPRFATLREEADHNRNYSGSDESRWADARREREKQIRPALKDIEAATDPSDEASMSRAIEALNNLQDVFDLRESFFEQLRGKVVYAARPQYVHIIARLEGLSIYEKLGELKICKAQWATSSTAVNDVLHDVGIPLVQLHAADFTFDGYLSDSRLQEVADLTGIPAAVLVLELIGIFAAPASDLPASIWIGLAAIACQVSKEGEGQGALRRLLNSKSAELASRVPDGAWKDGLYPQGEVRDVAAGLVWLVLGSPTAAKRWKAAHSVRCLARLGKWEVIDALVERFHSKDAGPYQAPELVFYFLHARLWLLIALARAALNHPKEVGRYQQVLEAVALDESTPHVLMRHFAAQALLACSAAGAISLDSEEVSALANVNSSPFPAVQTNSYRESFYVGQRPASMPEPVPEFDLDYDFAKTDVASVFNMFDRSRWETEDAVTAWVRRYDPEISSMYEVGGRRARQRGFPGMNVRYHTYGQQLGWHALYLVAGDFLARYPIVQRPYDEASSWEVWLGRELLTRRDGLWLADGVEWPPVDAQVNLTEKGEKDLVVTGAKEKLLGLLGIGSTISSEVVVAGDWRSVDGIGIHISSALAPSRQARHLARELAREDPFQAWLPQVEGYDDGSEDTPAEIDKMEPWIVVPSVEPRLDETDPVGGTSVARRLRFTRALNEVYGLTTKDQFGRVWLDIHGRTVARSEAWGRNRAYDEEEPISGTRLICTPEFLVHVLQRRRADLLLLLILRRFEKGIGHRGSQYWHTSAVVRIDRSLSFELFPGAVNALHKAKY